MQCTEGGKMKIKSGNVGVITLDNEARLYRVNYCHNDRLYVQSIDFPIKFRTVFPWHFWVLLDQF
jgi:hypothetical protein